MADEIDRVNEEKESAKLIQAGMKGTGKHMTCIDERVGFKVPVLN